MKYIYFIAFLLYGGCLNAQLLEYMSTPDWYHDYDIKFYKIDIEVNNTTVDIKGSATINAEICKSDLDHFTLELAKEILVDSVFMDGKAETYRRDGDLLYVLPSVSLIEGKMYSVRIVYHTISGTLQDNSFFSGISNRKDNPWDIAVTWTLSEPENAKKWFPCKQYLPDKADSAYIFLTVPDHLKAGASGVLHSVVPLAGGKHRYEWKTNYPIAYYLLSFAVSDYSEYNIYAHPQGVQDSLLVQNYIYNRSGYLEANRAVIDTTKVLIELYSKLYIPYPFANEKYGHCVAPMGGGMEHQTMTTISDFDFSLVAHELAHQWFGNLVTCASFQDIWINEGFTSYSEYLALEYLGSIKDADEWMKGAHAMACWSHKGSVFIPKESANDTWRIFSMSLSYKKGAALVHTIRHIIDNDELFFDVLRGFLQKYAYSTASAMDFKTFVEEKTNIDFTPFFVQWYWGEGFPIIDFSWTESDGQLSILMDHIGSAGSNPLFTMNIDLRISRRDGTDTIVKLPVTKNRERYSFAIANVSHIDIDPRYYILKEVRSNTLVKDLPSDDQFIICKTNVKRKQDLTITFKEQTNRNCQVLLTDPLGGKVFIKATIKGGKGTHVLPMSELNNGDYLLYVKNGRDQYVRKIVKTSF